MGAWKNIRLGVRYHAIIFPPIITVLSILHLISSISISEIIAAVNTPQDINPPCGYIIVPTQPSETRVDVIEGQNNISQSLFSNIYTKINGSSVIISNSLCQIEICGLTTLPSDDDDYDYGRCAEYSRNTTPLPKRPYASNFKATSISCGCNKNRPNCDTNTCKIAELEFESSSIGNCAVLYQENFCRECFYNGIILKHLEVFETKNSAAIKSIIVRTGCVVRMTALSNLFIDMPYVHYYYSNAKSNEITWPSFSRQGEVYNCTCPDQTTTSIPTLITTEPTTEHSTKYVPYEVTNITSTTFKPTGLVATTEEVNNITSTTLEPFESETQQTIISGTLDLEPGEPIKPETPQAEPASTTNSNYIYIIAGIGVLGSITLILLVIGSICYLRNQKRSNLIENIPHGGTKDYTKDMGGFNRHWLGWKPDLNSTTSVLNLEDDKAQLTISDKHNDSEELVSMHELPSKELHRNHPSSENNSKSTIIQQGQEPITVDQDDGLMDPIPSDEPEPVILSNEVVDQISKVPDKAPENGLPSVFTESVLEAAYDPAYEINRNDIIFNPNKTNSILGEGVCGIVYKGKLRRIGPNGVATEEKVAIKTVHPMTMDKKMIGLSIQNEIKVHAFLTTGNECKHIVSFLGACTVNIDRGEIFNIIEFCALGSVQSYLRSIKTQLKLQTEVNESRINMLAGYNQDCRDSEIDLDLLFNDMVKMSAQIAIGMEYLSLKKIIHIDLSSRNVLLMADKTVKISGFGLSKMLTDKDYYKSKTDNMKPWNWTALECLEDFKYSVKSDVWAYGITLWEIFSLAKHPYPYDIDSERLRCILNCGKRLDKPAYATEEIYERMLNCWDKNPDSRPEFSDLKDFFEKMHNSNCQTKQSLSQWFQYPLLPDIWLPFE